MDHRVIGTITNHLRKETSIIYSKSDFIRKKIDFNLYYDII